MESKKDKEQLKKRVTEAENKFKESEIKRNEMIFDIEKQRVQMQAEYDNNLNYIRAKDDIIANLERRRDILFRENELLKN